MRLTYDPAKRDETLANRGLDFDDAAKVFAGRHFDRIDDRFDYGEERIVTIGLLETSIIVIVWTQREQSRRIISMRKAHDHERRFFEQWLDGPR
ncbi:MAG: BrnT family toxin [Sphingopyxis sp.]|jgi:hypothetical protein|nr:BrnT family toxin [Sphingopyxis sp.]